MVHVGGNSVLDSGRVLQIEVQLAVLGAVGEGEIGSNEYLEVIEAKGDGIVGGERGCHCVVRGAGTAAARV